MSRGPSGWRAAVAGIGSAVANLALCGLGIALLYPFWALLFVLELINPEYPARLLDHLTRLIALPVAAVAGLWLGGWLVRGEGRRRVALTGLVLAFGLAWAFVPTWSGDAPVPALREAGRLSDELASLDTTNAGRASAILGLGPNLAVEKFPSVAWWAERRLDRSVAAWGRKVAEHFEAILHGLPSEEVGAYARLKEDPRLLQLHRWPDLEGRVRHAREAWEDAMAGQIVARFAAAPPGDLAAFQRCDARSNALAAEAGRITAKLQAARATWVRRTVDEQSRRLESLAAGDFAGYEAGRAARAALIHQFPETAGTIRDAETAWGERTLWALETEFYRSLGSDPVAVGERLRAPATKLAGWDEQAEARARLLEMRRKALAVVLDRARADSLELIRQERYARAEEVTAAFRERWAPEAKAVEMQADLDHLAESYAFLAELARRAHKPDPQSAR